MQNFDYVPQKSESVVDKARRERVEREKLRGQSAAALCIQKTWRRHRALLAAAEEQRAVFDATFRKFYPDEAAQKALRIGSPTRELPDASIVFAFVRTLVFLFSASHPADLVRMLNVCSLIVCSINSPVAGKNFCFLSVPTQSDTTALQWLHQTKKLLRRICQVLQRMCRGPLDPETKKQHRMAVSVLMRMLVSLTDHKKWAFVHPSKQRSEYTAQEERLVAFLSQTCTTSCLTLLQHLQGHDPTFRSPVHAFLLTFFDVPGLCSRLDTAATECLQHRTVWELITAHLLHCGHLPLGRSDAWPTRYILGNLIQLGATALASYWQSESDKNKALCGTWVECIRKLLDLMPPPSVTNGILQEEELLAQQLSAIWKQAVTQRLFATLFAEVEQRGACLPKATSTGVSGASSSEPKDAVRDWKDSLRAKRDKISSLFKKKSDESDRAKAESLQLQAAAAVFSAPMWLPVCHLYNRLIAGWNSRSVLVSLCFKKPYLVNALWDWITIQNQNGLVNAFVEDASSVPSETETTFTAVLTLFCHLYNNFLLITDGDEFYTTQRPFPLPTVVSISGLLNRLAFRLVASTEVIRTSHTKEVSQPWLKLRDLACLTVLKLRDRDVRRRFVPQGHWLVFGSRLWGRYLSSVDLDNITLLVSLLDGPSDVGHVMGNLPHAVPFDVRVKVFNQKVYNERDLYHVQDKKWQINIRRPFIIEDGFDAFAQISDGGDLRLKAKLHIVFQNAHGLAEAGIDAGGVFKEFLTECLKQLTDPTFGLFKFTADDHLYPNPASGLAHKNHLQLFKFTGRIAAKALYEGIVANLPFAEFFLNFILQKPNLVDDLASQDPELYKNLMYLKSPDCDLEMMCLTFCVEEDVMGQKVKHDLRPRGEEVDVTEDNLISYIHAMADYKLNAQIAQQTRAFLSGYYEVIKPEWLRMFDRRELSSLISGEARALNIEDLRAHTQYAGGYSDEHRVIKTFWDVLAGFNREQQAKFLQFVTSCPKPPLLGFENLHPPLCIRLADDGEGAGIGRALGVKDIDRLPSASTCFNLLKLPPYRTKKQLKEKLLYAINAGSGFELS